MSDALLVEIENHVARIILNRPAVHNAFDDALIEDIISALTHLANRDDVRVLVLTSNGKHFSAGADLNWMKRMAGLSQTENRADAQRLAQLMYQLNDFPKPTLALVDGATYGGAVGLVACCDMAIATQRSNFCLSEVKIGLSPAVISPFVVDAIGTRAARRYFLSAEVFDAQCAAQLGLLHSVANDAQDLSQQGQALISKLLANSPQAMLKSKQLIKYLNHETQEQAKRDYTVNLIAAIRVSDEGQEGLTSFLDKRTPNWLVDTEL